MSARPALCDTLASHARLLRARGGPGDAEHAAALFAGAEAGWQEMGMGGRPRYFAMLDEVGRAPGGISQ